jgi:hypothetical protein
MTTMSVLSATGDAGAGIEVGWGSLKVLVSFKALFVLIVMRIP